MDRYQRVEKPREEAPIKENEIRITTQGRMRNYITYATALLQDKGSDEVVFKAMGRAINKTVMIAELIKRRIVGLHQNTTTGSTDITDMWEPLEEGLLPLETTRHVSMITITLSKKELDTSSVGYDIALLLDVYDDFLCLISMVTYCCTTYQPPLPADEVKPLVGCEIDEDAHSPGGRGRGRGGRGLGRGRGRGRGGRGNGYNDYADGGWGEDDHAPEYMGNGYPRGRGRGFRGRGRRGGYGGQIDYQQDGGYYEEAPVPAPVRGRGRGRARGRGPSRGRGRGGNVNGVMPAAAAGAQVLVFD
ncbi:hypothetical protein BAE44_0003257 [Dichanthelium oligosanthes]|uniref:DNA/RNA-binding protein Alba-like domain-containing protein n=1 Tax=Dichanthelium oligosanthes TaxID=888268 RepID=A0A1E5WEU0_9POAL|nr:hypothetical protein BAE44_0003257 [Dichanthelium oligosanthes]